MDQEGMARPERFELPTTWFEVRLLTINVLFSKEYREGARCIRCTTVHNHAQLSHAELPQWPKATLLCHIKAEPEDKLCFLRFFFDHGFLT